MTALDTRPDLNDTVAESLDHYICGSCWPDYVPGRQVVAYCGRQVHDTNLYDDSLSADGICPLCVLHAEARWPCPRCGT